MPSRSGCTSRVASRDGLWCFALCPSSRSHGARLVRPVLEALFLMDSPAARSHRNHCAARAARQIKPGSFVSCVAEPSLPFVSHIFSTVRFRGSCRWLARLDECRLQVRAAFPSFPTCRKGCHGMPADRLDSARRVRRAPTRRSHFPHSTLTTAKIFFKSINA